MLGNTLKQARESRELPLREIEWATKIKSSYLEALEAEDFENLPAPVYARGFLRTYARYLDLDPDPLIAEYNQQAVAANEIVSTRPAVRPDRRPFALTPGMIVGAVCVVLLAVFLLYVKGQFDHYQASLVTATSTPSVRITPAPSPSDSPAVSPTASPVKGIQVAIRLDARTWIKVLVDGKASDQTTSSGTVFADGTVLNFSGDKTVRVVTGRANHTFITVNGREIGAVSGADQGVADQTYTPASTAPSPSPAR
jgi:cytoskeletal protein RodZ